MVTLTMDGISEAQGLCATDHESRAVAQSEPKSNGLYGPEGRKTSVEFEFEATNSGDSEWKES